MTTFDVGLRLLLHLLAIGPMVFLGFAIGLKPSHLLDMGPLVQSLLPTEKIHPMLKYPGPSLGDDHDTKHPCHYYSPHHTDVSSSQQRCLFDHQRQQFLTLNLHHVAGLPKCGIWCKAPDNTNLASSMQYCLDLIGK